MKSLYILIIYCFEVYVNGQGYNQEKLRTLTEYRQQYRKTIDGRLCAAAFVQDNNSYTNCTSSRAPDGTIGSEWCYVEVQALNSGLLPWNFCLESINYDAVRRKIYEDNLKYKNDNNITILIEEKNKLKKTLNLYNEICGSEENVITSSINKNKEKLDHFFHLIKQVQSSSKKYNATKNIILKLRENIENHRYDSKNDNMVCIGLPGYDEDLTNVTSGDGLRATYFNNINFDDLQKINKIDQNIDFVWDNYNPAQGISHTNFSVIWEGFFTVPISDKYILTAESDGGSRVFINDLPVIIDRMPEPKEIGQIDTFPLHQITGEVYGSQKVDSQFLTLLSTQAYKIRVEMFHSNRLLWINPELATMRLLWRTNTQPETAIEPKFFHSSYPKPLTQISGINPTYHKLSNLVSGEYLYMDSRKSVITSVPTRFEGRRVLKTSYNSPQGDNFSILLNAPTRIYIAAYKGSSFPILPLNNMVKPEDDEILIVNLDQNNIVSSAETYKIVSFEADGNAMFKVFSKNSPYLIFFEQAKSNYEKCEGLTSSLSDITSPFYSRCRASSSDSSAYSCESGLSSFGKSEWRTKKGKTVGEYIGVTFNKPVIVDSFLYRPPKDKSASPSAIKLYVDNKFYREFDISNNEKIYNFDYAVKIGSIDFTISKMMVSGDYTGGYFEVLGTPCNSQYKQFKNTSKPEIQLSCSSTLENISAFATVPVISGYKFIATCKNPVECLEDYPVYGHVVYSSNSSICAAAIHAGICSKNDYQPCSFELTIQGKQSSYSGIYQNGVGSKDLFSPSNSFYINRSNFASKLEKARPKVYFRNITVYFQPLGKNDVATDDGSALNNRTKGISPFYGWKASANLIQCGEANAKFGVQFPSSENSWNIKTGNGIFKVTVIVENICDTVERDSFIQINGEEILSVKLLPNNEYTKTAVVNVSNEEINVTAECRSDDCTNSKTTLKSIRIKRESTLI